MTSHENSPAAAATADDSARWYPVMPSSGLPSSATVALGFVQGEELALWRAENGTAQAWVNRCPHRGMRFTLGRVLNGRLSCAYHGWEYEADSGRCAGIPAHPHMPVPRTICAKIYPAREVGGMIWVSRGIPPTETPVAANGTIARTLGIRAPLAFVANALAAQGWSPKAPDVLTGKVVSFDAVSYLTHAGNDLVLMHVSIDADAQTLSASNAHAALRQLRNELEASWTAEGAHACN